MIKTIKISLMPVHWCMYHHWLDLINEFTDVIMDCKLEGQIWISNINIINLFKGWILFPTINFN